MSEPSSPIDVMIAGAGPVGLFLACELRLAGASVTILERAEDPGSPLKMAPFGQRGLTIPTMAAFARRGLLDILGGAATPRRQAGHFAGIPVPPDKVDPACWSYRLETYDGGPSGVELGRIEAALAARASALGARIIRGVAIEAFEQSDAEVLIRAGDRTFRARWLVGCDGGRSTVRAAGGFTFVGTEPEFTGYSIKADVADPGVLALGRRATAHGMYFQMQPGCFALQDFDGGRAHRAGPLTREGVQAVLRRVSCTDATIQTLHVATTWTDRAKQATTYRRGRVLLAGDAAHIHAPLGGQGLNLGLGDALNLGWKLAATVRGEAPDGLLDTYQAERHPVGAQVLDWSRAQVAVMRPDPATRALAAVVRDLVGTGDGATYVAERVWNATLRHALDDRHALTGRIVPDLAMTDGTRLTNLMRDGKGVLIDRDGRAALRALARDCGDRVGYVDLPASAWTGPRALLVRPDGVVAWACDGDPDLGEATEAAARWFPVQSRTGRAAA